MYHVNIEQVDFGGVKSELEEVTTGTVTFNSDVVASGGSQVIRVGKVVTLRVYCVLSTEIAGNNGVIATLPEGFRPSALRQTINICGAYGGSYNATIGGKINTNGTIATGQGSGKVSNANGNIVITATYIL